ncbi:hypothetical protein RHMOL_Rhmol04G0277900 [Rhododendron molle]|uniref:Uncharacterized protein n=1 Tax=Rhododendron molle TaxID=49168 RepID=A0ACC0P6E8_RHOML|nr:hypothetical protein RHMOL_Rhmol04G0277900 [Rhododendron molle]
MSAARTQTTTTFQPPPPPPQHGTFRQQADRGAGRRTPTAPRWIPKRGRVLKNVLKKIFPCFSGQRPRSRRSPVVVAHCS